MNVNWRQSGNAQFGSNLSSFLVPCDLEIWWLTLENNRAPLVYHVKLCPWFQSHWWIKTWVTVRKRSIRVKIGDVLSCMTLKFDGWSWKTIRHLFCAASRFVHYFIAISEFELELQSGNAQFGSKSMICCLVWLWNLTDHVTLKNNRAPLLSNINLCASFHHHMWIKTKVTVRKRLNWVLTPLTSDLDLLHRHHFCHW